MKYSDWKTTLAELDVAVDVAERVHRDALQTRDIFYKETVEFESGDIPSLQGMARMIAKVFAMLKEDEK